VAREDCVAVAAPLGTHLPHALAGMLANEAEHASLVHDLEGFRKVFFEEEVEAARETRQGGKEVVERSLGGWCRKEEGNWRAAPRDCSGAFTHVESCSSVTAKKNERIETGN
jgi:hypothetical protein